MDKKPLTQERLKELLDYDPETGVFTWRVQKGHKLAGQEAGTITNKGYAVVSINRKHYQLHRLAFLWMKGELPQKQVDHINGNRSDNRFSNLRLVSHRENSCNQKMNNKNTSGVVGVHYCNTHNRWISKIKVKGKAVSLYYGKSKNDAIKERKAAEIKYGFHENHGRAGEQE